MRKDITCSPGRSDGSYRYLAVTMAFSLSMLISVLDIAAYLMRNPGDESGISVLAPVFAASMITVAVVLLVFWFLVVWPFGKVLKLHPGRLGIAFAGFVLAIYVLLVIHGDLKYGSFPSDLRIPVLAIGVVGMALLIANVIYRLFSIVSVRRIVIFARALAVVWLVLLMVSLAMVFMGRGGIDREDVQSVSKGHAVKKVILITIDALRADAVSCYNDELETTKHIDLFSRDGVVFKRAFSAAPWTLPSVSSIMTGLPPMVHGVVSPHNKLQDNLTTLAEYMRKDGYFTGGIGHNAFLTKRYNFSQGFSDYIFPNSKRVNTSLIGRKVLCWLFGSNSTRPLSTTAITDETIKWVDGHKGDDFFLWIHYLDPHLPYELPAEYRPAAEPPSSKVGYGFSMQQVKMTKSGYLTFSLAERQWVRDLYHSEVRYVDDNVGRLLKHLKELGIYDDSLIIISSDHGDDFWDHEQLGHGHTLYNELLLVPLIVKPSGFFDRAGEIETPVSTEAIMPTVLDLCGIKYDVGSLARASLSAFWQSGRAAPKEELLVASDPYLYEGRISGCYDGYKYIISLITGEEELYDLAKDPGEQVNIAVANPERLGQLKAMLEDYKQNVSRLKKQNKVNAGEEAKLDKETIKKLKSLGYLH